MSPEAKKNIRLAKDIISWVILIVISLTFVYSIYSIHNDLKDGKRDGMFVLGYQPMYVKTGSMEPYMMTNSIAIAKKIDSIEDISVGDVVTYHITGSDNNLLRITHRITAIEGDLIYTKGDNNNVSDGFPLKIDNIKSKVVMVINETAWIAAKWETPTGKVMLISFGIGILLCLYLLNTLWSKIPFPWREADLAESNLENIEAEVVQSKESINNDIT